MSDTDSFLFYYKILSLLLAVVTHRLANVTAPIIVTLGSNIKIPNWFAKFYSCGFGSVTSLIYRNQIYSGKSVWKEKIKDKTFNENISVIEDIESCYFCHSFIKYNEETGENKTILIRSPEVTIFCKTSSDPPTFLLHHCSDVTRKTSYIHLIEQGIPGCFIFMNSSLSPLLTKWLEIKTSTDINIKHQQDVEMKII